MLNMLKKKIPLGPRRAISRIMKTLLRKWIFSTVADKLSLSIVTREDLLNNGEKYHVRQFGSEETILLSDPYNSSDSLPRLVNRKNSKFVLKKPFVSEVANAELVGSASVAFDEEGKLIAETVMPDRSGIKQAVAKRIPVPTLILKKLIRSRIPQLDTVCSLAGFYSQSYYHWTIEFLSRLEGLEHYQKETGIKPTLIIDANPPAWQIESLKLLGYKPEDCLPCNQAKVKVKRLVVPSFRHEHRFLVSPVKSATALRWLRQRLVSNLPEVGSQNTPLSSRIYISRAKSVGRHVTNEDEVISALAPLGFVVYKLENLSFTDQVRLFSQAEMVVAPHGAGLANIIFAQNLTVIELFDSQGTPDYFLLSNALGFRYGCLASGDRDEKNKSRIMYEYSRFSKKYSGILVDSAKLRTLVGEMLSTGSDRQPSNAAC
jgi:Glycosyltransferase 61